MDNSKLTIDILDDIGGWGFNTQSLVSQVRGFDGDTVEFPINSYGGSVTEGLAIYNVIKGLNVKTTAKIVGYAMSMGTVISASADTVEMPKNAWYMIHDAWMMSSGDSDSLKKDAELLDKMSDQIASIYSRKTGLSKSKIRKMMKEETWLTAKEAKSFGFVDKITDGVEISAKLDTSKYLNIPKELTNPTNKMDNTFLNKLASLVGLSKDASQEEVLNKVTEMSASKDEIVNTVSASLEKTILATLREEIKNSKVTDEHIASIVKANVSFDGYAKVEDIPTVETLEDARNEAVTAIEAKQTEIVESLVKAKEEAIANHTKNPSSEKLAVRKRGGVRAANKAKYTS